MNANELADALEKDGEDCNCYAYGAYECGCGATWGEVYIKQAATMLRQQQAEIEKLKDEVAEWKMSYENCHRVCNGYGMN